MKVLQDTEFIDSILVPLRTPQSIPPISPSEFSRMQWMVIFNLALHPGISLLSPFAFLVIPNLYMPYSEAKTILPIRKIIDIANKQNHNKHAISFVRDVVALLSTDNEAGSLSLVRGNRANFIYDF